MGDTQPKTDDVARPTVKRGCSGLDNPDEKLKCVFSTRTIIKVGTGTTAKKQESKLLWYVKQQAPDEFGVRKINPQYVPVGEEETIDQQTLLADYTPEVAIHNTQVEPAMVALKKTLAMGDKHRAKGELLSAEMEYTKALDVDETNVRAIFGLGLVYLDKEDTDKAQVVFNDLVELQAAFDLKHKHLFNEFGIALRKNGLHAQAVQYYTRAVDLTKVDDNLYYNVSRAFYEMDDWGQCIDYAGRALRLNPGHTYALSLCRFALALSADKALQEKHGKPPAPEKALKEAEALVAGQDSEVEELEMPMVELDG